MLRKSDNQKSVGRGEPSLSLIASMIQNAKFFQRMIGRSSSIAVRKITAGIVLLSLAQGGIEGAINPGQDHHEEDQEADPHIDIEDPDTNWIGVWTNSMLLVAYGLDELKLNSPLFSLFV